MLSLGVLLTRSSSLCVAYCRAMLQHVRRRPPHTGAPSVASSTYSTASIEVTPSPCLLDEPVKVFISGLQGNEVYTLQSSITDCKDIQFMAVAHYKSDDKGEIDLTRTPAIGGHFTGVFPMGPFAALLPVSKKLKDPRFSFRDVTKPQTFELSVHEGAVGYLLLMDPEASGLTPLCQALHERRLVGEGCRALPVNFGKVRGVLHLPRGSGPFPGVVDLFGSAGGIMEHRAALLAARGVAALSLPFFNYQDLPTDINYLHIEYFEEAVQFLMSRDEVSKEGVGAIGTSKGGDIVLDMALAIPHVKVAVVINGSCFSAEAAMLSDGKAIRTPLTFDVARVKIQRDVRFDFLHLTEETTNEAEIIPVEQIPGHVFWVVGADDKNWTSEKFAKVASERYLKHNPHAQDKFQVVRYKGAGHLIEPPYVPFCEVSYHRMVNGSVVWGGNAVDHTNAQVDAWRRMIALFYDKLLPRVSKL